MSLRHGFKAIANRISLRLRRGQGRAPIDPVDLKVIAARLKITLVPLSAFKAECPQAVEHLIRKDSGAFSAATLLIGGKRVLIYNDSHDPGRQRANIAHELAHVLLGHPFTCPIDGSGCRTLDLDLEDEANWLGPTILISNEAALHILKISMSSAEACRIYGVSGPLLTMRINASGARIRLERAVH